MYLYLKRIADVLFSLLILLILSPFLIIIIITLLSTGEHEVFYLQDRVGYHNKRFRIIKFATMLKNSPNIGTGSLTVRRDPRVLPFGHFLRITKLNELPQLINVLLGHMSFIGPRPLMPVDFDCYNTYYRQRIYLSRPGITGVGSVIFRDEQKLISETNKAPREFYREDILPAKGALEIWYQENKGFITDIKILFITVWVLIFPNSKMPYRLFDALPTVHDKVYKNLKE
jgi:lipopolysaccharide/colanic/teichoic acid biosynthesis glycosyltransferase